MQANRTLARLKTLFSWALDKDLIDNDPTARVRRRIKESAPRSSPQRRRNPPFLGRLRKAGLAFRPDVQAAAADRATAGRGGGHRMDRDRTSRDEGLGHPHVRMRRTTARTKSICPNSRSRSLTGCREFLDRAATVRAQSPAHTCSPPMANGRYQVSARPRSGSTGT